MYRAIPHVLVQDAASSVSFISTDTARFEVVDDRLYYVFNGTAYNVDVNTISFDFMAKSGNVNLLNGKVEAKKINDYGYNYTYEVWSDISDMKAGTGRMYPHVLYNNGLSQDAIDFHWASKGTEIDYKGKHYYMDSEYNMPVLEITAA